MLLLGLLADPGDLGLGPVADAGDVVIGLAAQVGGLGGGVGLDGLDVGLGVRGELLERVGSGALGGRLHRLGQVGHELVRLAGGGRAAATASRLGAGGSGRVGGRGPGVGGRRGSLGGVVRGGGRRVDHVGPFGLLAGTGVGVRLGRRSVSGLGDRAGISGRLVGLGVVLAPGEPEPGLGLGRGHSDGPSLTQCRQLFWACPHPASDVRCGGVR